MISGGVNGAWYNSKWVDFAWTVGIIDRNQHKRFGNECAAGNWGHGLVPCIAGIGTIPGTPYSILAATPAEYHFELASPFQLPG